MDPDVAVGELDLQCAVGGECEFPAAFVREVVVPVAQRQHVVDVGSPVGIEPAHVVDLAVFEHHVAARTGAVERSQGAALFAVGETLGAPEE